MLVAGVLTARRYEKQEAAFWRYKQNIITEITMEGILKVTPEKLISTADEFQTTGSQVRNLTQEMISMVDSLKSSWEGEAATAYSTKFHQLEDDMEKMHRMIDEHVKDLNEMARQYQTAESANIDTSSSLTGDVIS